jgi:cytochrome c oxidase cbb3-type subunit 3
MKPRSCVALFVALLTATAPVAGQSGASPASPALIARGDSVYHGAGNCYACHGAKAEGLVGPNLTDAEWLHSKGTYEEIVAQIQEGITKEKSKSGIPMPAKGGGSISDDDIKAVAAYVHSLGQRPGS